MHDDVVCSSCGARLQSENQDGRYPGSLTQPSGSVSSTPGGARMLETQALATDSMPRVRLRDDAAAATQPPAGPSSGSAEMRGQAEGRPRLELFGEIARGGMGAVLMGRDVQLGRDLAVKVLLESHCEKPEMVRRFVEEAQIGGQLQHPGVVPVYELGSFLDQRPFFTMKLVKGRTLAELIRSRSQAGDDLPRFLSIFESICLTLAYAHARGVIHRDLKPANVMVGSFGEVQVMDWGLAKVLRPHGEPVEHRPDQEDVRRTVIATGRADSGADASLAGSVLGTPAYMAPEQARGEIEVVDERADVFGLGAILCEVLTGQPAFVGRVLSETMRKATRGELDEAFARLDGCGAQPELIALARDCLAPVYLDRPRHAGIVAERMTAYLAGVQERLRKTELARAQADARAHEERKRRRLAMALAAAILLLMAVGGTSAAVYVQHRRDQTSRLDLALRDVYLLREQAMATGEPAQWHEVVAAATRAVDLIGPLADASSSRAARALQVEAAAAAESADRDAALLQTLMNIRADKSKDPSGSAGDAAYAKAFRDAGIDIEALGPDAAAAKIRARLPRQLRAIAAAIDDWSSRRRKATPNDAKGLSLLAATASAADPDAARNRLRAIWLQPVTAQQREPLLAVAKLADPETWAVQTLTLLAASLLDAGEPAAAALLLDRTWPYHPDDVWVNHTLGTALEAVYPPRTDDAIRFYRAARALRPETAHDLAHALNRRGLGDEALAVFKHLVEIQPNNGWHWGCLSTLLETRGAHTEALEAMEKALPKFRETLSSRPDDIAAHINLGGVLSDVKYDFEAAATEYREALRIEPDNVKAHFGLGNVFREQGKLDEAAGEYHEALRLKPDFAPAHHNLAYILIRERHVDRAIAEGRESLRLQPDSVIVPGHLAWILAVYPDRPQRDYDEAAALARKTLEATPKAPGSYATLALAEYRRGHWDDALAAVNQSLTLRKGGQAADWFLLALIHARKGEKEIARTWFDKAVERARTKNLKEVDVQVLWREAATLLGRPA